jgi:DNA-binding NarL/FixJ family response regulator
VRKNRSLTEPRRKSEFRGTVLLADDDVLFRMGLLQLLRRRLKVKRCLEAASFLEVCEHLKQKDMRLAIIDLRMPGLSGAKDIAQIRLLHPDVLVVVLSGSDRREDILDALSAGVHGYIVKSQDIDQLADRLRYILSGEIYVPPILAEPSNRDARPEQRTLSSRQREVLRGIVEGKSNKEIAQALNIAEGTVKMHLSALLRVLGATNRAHAAALGKQLLG